MQQNLAVNPYFNLSNKLKSSSLVFVSYVSFAAFVAYSSMYGVRKPYTVGLYSNLFYMGISYKVCLVIAQVMGYMISKFYGIRFISGMQPQNRIRYIIYFIGIAWLSLLLFAVIPPPYNIICMFLNGLPLGMIFGLVFGFLEGRKTTEIMGAFLATSFIFASGLAKTTGKWVLLKLEVPEMWMPFVAGAFFILPLLLAVFMLYQISPPSPTDVALRSKRMPMTKEERKSFIKQFGFAITPIVVSYAIFTIVRDFCEDFANELWIETGYQDISIFAKTSTIMSVIVLVIIGSFFVIKSNYRAFIATHYLIVFGIFLAVIATIFFQLQFISPLVWMIIATTGLYLAYLPFNCIYFERMLSTYQLKANVGFVMYIADAFGYLGTVLVLLVKEFLPIHFSWVDFFSFLFYGTGIIGILLVLYAVTIHKKIYASINSIK